jgi:glycine cleavage system H protein
LKKGETFGVVESIKAVSDLYAPVTGKVVEVNTALPDDPAKINREPQAGAWIAKIEMTDPSSASDLLDAAAYEKFVASLK